jgi:hypothetical protein
VGLKLAVYLIITAIVGLSVGVGLYDYRAGIICFFLISGGVGLWHLSQE